MAAKKQFDHSDWTVKTQAEVAQFFDKSVDTIAKWRSKGMPGRPGEWNLSSITIWLFTMGPHKSQEYIDAVLERAVYGENGKPAA